MARTTIKYIKSNYKGVNGFTVSRYTYWKAQICGVVINGLKTEREAAKAVDLILIEKYKEPLNILVRKTDYEKTHILCQQN